MVGMLMPQTGRVNLEISPDTREVKFSLGEGKKSTGSGFTGSVIEGWLTWSACPEI